MSKIINVSTLGARKVKRVEQRQVPDRMNPNIMKLEMFIVEVEEIQPILSPEEAQVLAEEEWTTTTKELKQYGKYMCKAGGRRFFCSEKPSPKKKDESCSMKSSETNKNV